MVDERRVEDGKGWAALDLDPDFDRLRTTLLVSGEPDRVPTVELLVDREIKEAFLGRPLQSIQDDVEFWYRAGYDYIHIRAGYEYRMVGDGDAVAASVPRLRVAAMVSAPATRWLTGFRWRTIWLC